MPPVYDIICDKCNVEALCIRSMTDVDVTPTPDELPANVPECEHQWRKKLGKVGVTKGWNWTRHGGKGNWLVLMLPPATRINTQALPYILGVLLLCGIILWKLRSRR